MSLTSIYFASPIWLWITAAALALFAFLLWHAARMRRKQLAQFADPASIEPLMRSHSRARRVVKSALLGVTLLAAGIALARPQWGVSEESIQRRGEDVVFVLDLSKSMLAQDEKPSRLQRAKIAILDFIHREQVGRVGLVVFAGTAFARCPLTMDYAAFEESVSEAMPDDLYIGGTDIGRGIIAAKNTFDTKAERKVVVLLTDGEDLGAIGVDSAKEFAKDGLTIFTIGIGTPAGAELRVPQPSGQLAPLLDEKGQPVVSRLDETTLRGIAEATNGTYRRLENLTQSMSDVARAIQTGDGPDTAAKMRRRGIDRYVWPLAVATLILIAESFLSTRRRNRAAKPA